MRPPIPSPAALPVVWIQVLDTVEATLRRTEAEVAEREQTLSATSAASDAEATCRSGVRQSLQQLEQERRDQPAALQQAEKEACDADAALQAGEEALRLWLDRAAALERRLATWGNYEV